MAGREGEHRAGPPRAAGLRVDVCTFEGLRVGLPRLLDAFARRGLRATIFSAMGPDRSGLAVFRLFRKRGFLGKMLRTRAASMYGFRTALQGTLLPAPRMAERGAGVLRRAVEEGHEVGVHGWDHVRWQDRLDSLPERAIREDYERALDAFERAVGRLPSCTAAPAWLASEGSLAVEAGFPFGYASDTRGRGPFLPVAGGRVLPIPQVPVTLPTLDEELGRGGLTAEGFVERILSSLVPGAPNVFTAHAEAEGRVYLRPFEELLDRAGMEGWSWVPLGEVVPRELASLPVCPVERMLLPGRAGSVSIQAKALPGKRAAGTGTGPET
jgi:undecaprenyl phosphate-alpha-L-ara4FN deformylase